MARDANDTPGPTTPPKRPRAAHTDDSDDSQASHELNEFVETPAPPKRNPPAAGTGAVNPPAYVRQLRIATIARALVDGLGRAAIMQAVAKHQLDEAAKRARARAMMLEASGQVLPEELAALVPIVWGDVPMPERTIDSYLARAKDTLADEGKRVSRHREYVLALQLARLNEVYRAAFDAGRFHVALGAVKEINSMFGMPDAIKTMLLQEAREQSDAAQAGGLRTEENKLSAMSALMKKAAAKDPSMSKVFAKFAELSAAPKLAE